MNDTASDEVSKLAAQLAEAREQLGRLKREANLAIERSGQYRSAISGLWYMTAAAAGTISAVKQFGVVHELLKGGDATCIANTEPCGLTSALAQNEKLRSALKALLHQCSNIEVLGEWEVSDTNRTMAKTMRAKVNDVINQACAALAQEAQK